MFYSRIVSISKILQLKVKNSVIFTSKCYCTTTKCFYFSSQYQPFPFRRPLISPFAFLLRKRMTTAEIPDKLKYKNRLANEKSPYLLLHATNPVDWYPWGEEAFKKARDEDKLIFLSIGFFSCHWCHLMERESFENLTVAQIMNEYFVNIKVDREERPDIDRIYMKFIQATTNFGGWPLNVFLTPDLHPISGGTYFPPTNLHLAPSFTSVLLHTAQKWNEHRYGMSSAAKKIAELLEKELSFDVETAGKLIEGKVPGCEVWEKCQEEIYEKYEPQYGGFSFAPKFPPSSFLKYLFHRHIRNPDDLHATRSKAMSLHTLDCMALGGIRDHIGQGFARFSVDHKWRVPHFEKMLYDQAQLAVAYSQAFQLTQNNNYEYVARGILTYVSRDLSHPEGGFYSAESSDSQIARTNPVKKQGIFYTWEYDEILKLLNKRLDTRSRYTEGELFCFHYGIKRRGNVKPEADPMGELYGRNILSVKGKPFQTCEKFGIQFEQLKSVLKDCKETLFKERQKRPRPQVDDKIITAWNALMISGYAKASFILNDKSYADRAVAAAEFIKKYLYNPINKKLFRSCYGKGKTVTKSETPIDGMQTDYAFLIQGLLDLYECTFNQEWLVWANELQHMQDELFWDHGYAGYFFTTSNHQSTFRFKEDQDAAEPCGNSVAATNLLRLGMMLHDEEMRNKASQIFVSFTGRLTKIPSALPGMVSALLLYHDFPVQVVVTGNLNNNETSELINVLRKRPVPGLVVMTTDDADSFLCLKNAAIKKMQPQSGKQAAYICRGRTCTLPIISPAELAAQLNI